MQTIWFYPLITCQSTAALNSLTSITIRIMIITVANQKKKLLLVAMFVGQMEPYDRDASQKSITGDACCFLTSR